MTNCSINIWDGSELELPWSEKSSSYFQNNFPIFLLSGILNISIFKVRDVSGWVNLYVMKIFYRICYPVFSVAPSVGAADIWIYFASH